MVKKAAKFKSDPLCNQVGQKNPFSPHKHRYNGFLEDWNPRKFIGFRKRPILGRKSAKETLGQQLRKKLGVGLEGPRRAFNALRNHDRAVTQKMKANLRANLKEPSFKQVLWQSLRPLFS